MSDKLAHPLFRCLVLAFMGLIVAQPLFKPAMLCGDDFPGHLSYAIELDQMWSEGEWYPRWSPNVAFGRGLPTFNFYPPLPRYIAVLVHRLGLPLRDATKAPMVLAFVLAGPAMYLFARSIFGERAGMAAGIAYAFAPYLADDALQRFALNETLALALVPLALWTLGRLDAHRLDAKRIALAALAVAALLLTHTLMALMFAPIIAGYVLLVWWNSQHKQALFGGVLLTGLIAGGLTSFFWLPFMAEAGNVQMWRARVWELTGELLYPLHFRSLSSILWPRALWPDYTTGNSLLQRMVALPQVIGALIALVLVRQCPTRLARAATVLFGLTLVVSILLIVPASKPLWDVFSPLQIVQFPWRFLGPASLAAALLTGALWAHLFASRLISNTKGRIVLDALFVLIMAAWTLPWLRPFTCNIEPNPARQFLVWMDRKTEGGGGTGEHLPKWVESPPDESPLEADLLEGRPLDRFDRTSLPQGATADVRVLKSLDSTWQVNSPQTFTATFQTYYYPGWTLRVDNRPVPVSPAQSTGLIEARVPAGQHTINLCLEATLTQTLGGAISISTALAIGVWLLLRRRSATASGATTNDLPISEMMALTVMGLVLFVTRPMLASIAPPAVPDGLAIPTTVTRTFIDLSGQVELIGYEFSAVRAGEPLTVTVYWQANHLLLTSYKSFVHVIDAQGKVVAQSDVVPRNWTYPTFAWFPNERVVDPHRLDIPRDARGPLQVEVGMYDPETGERLKPKDDPSGAIKLGALTLIAPQ